jgi:hypothetical protein
MEDYLKDLKQGDNEGRRFLVDRRQFSYTMHVPERRSGIDRRGGEDRRKSPRIY